MKFLLVEVVRVKYLLPAKGRVMVFHHWMIEPVAVAWVRASYEVNMTLLLSPPEGRQWRALASSEMLEGQAPGFRDRRRSHWTRRLRVAGARGPKLKKRVVESASGGQGL
jgi:hypothetical protein